MFNRPLYILLLLFLPTAYLVAQSDRSTRAVLADADKFYEGEQYNLASQLYRELSDHNLKNPEVDYRLADCYRYIFNYKEAEAYYLKVHYQAAKEFPLALYYYALMLKYNGHFDESIVYFDAFIGDHLNNAALKEYVEQAQIDRAGSETARGEVAEPSRVLYPLVTLPLNSPYNDYAPAVRDSTTLVITSGRVASNRQSIDERFGEAFTDNYYFEKQGNTWSDKTKQLFGITNTRYNDGSGCFNSKGDKYYFTVCGAEGPQCKIYLSAYRNGKWSEPQALNDNINFKNTESKHPAVSHGGDTLIFSSNRGGGQGHFDLWMSINAGNDNWGPAMNLGSAVNTKLNELSPSFTAFPNVLFFASDGHQGYGGLDLYMLKRLSSGEQLVYNLDAPFNSNRDDCFISFSDRQLFWSSNRGESFDVLSVKIPSVLAFISRLSLKKRSARNDINLKSKTAQEQRLNLAATSVEDRIDYDNLTYDKKRLVDAMIQNRARNVSSTADQFHLTQQEFELLSRIADVRYQQLKLKQKGYLTHVPVKGEFKGELTIQGVLVDSLTQEMLALRVMLTDSLGEVLKITGSNGAGKFRFTGVSSDQPLYLRLEKQPERDGLLPVVVGLKIEAAAVEENLPVENVYFDFNHYDIRPEASRALNALADLLIRTPGAQVEVYAFADDRGSNAYNLQLTQKRGQAVVDYLRKQGVDETGLVVIAKGKQLPQETDTELQRQYNRRVEFLLNGRGQSMLESVKTYIVRKPSTWSALAGITGVDKNTLKILNGALSDDVQAFQPVRVPERGAKIPADLFFIGH
jgi:outer membrane protein OmpA-like peptidoglycan-associated protein/tetratricopeptide (TPR) repeat protein